MATTEQFLTSGSSTTSYTFSIDTIKDSDIKVKVNGSNLTYTTSTPSAGQYKISGSGITLGTAANAIHVYRETELENGDSATYVAGSSIRAADLNANHKLVRFASQEQNQITTTEDIKDSAVTSAKIKDETIVNADVSGSAGISYSKLNLNGQIVIGDLASGTLDSRYYTETESEALFLRQDSSENIASGDTWSSTDSKVATSAAIDARIIDLVDDVGGFVPIANETSFPNANPDVNNGAGTLVSIKALSSNLVSNGSGVATITNGTVGNSTVTITGLANSTTYASTFGMIVETTSTLNTYSFHRYVPKATEVHSVATNMTNLVSVAGNETNINAVVANATNINEVANNSANINTVAGEITLAEDLGSIANALTTYTGNDINTVADNISNVNTVANNINNLSGASFSVDQSAKTTGSLVYYDGSEFKADTTTTKSSLVIGGNF